MAGTVASPDAGPCTPALHSGKQHSQSGRSADPVGLLPHPPSSSVGTRYGLALTSLGVSIRLTRLEGRALLHSGVGFTGSWNSSDPSVRNQPPVGSAREQMDGVEKRTYRAFSLVVCRYRSRPSFSTQLLRRTHFRERAEEAVWWRRGQDGGAFEDSERLGPSPQEG